MKKQLLFVFSLCLFSLGISAQTNMPNGDVYVLDAQSYINMGDVICFDSKGNFKFRIDKIGVNPNHIVFLSQ